MSSLSRARAQLSLPVVGEAPTPGRAGGAVFEVRNQVEYVELPVRSVLNKVDGRHMKNVFSVNPYRGCELGCAYCYARYTHEFLDLPDWEAFERRIFVKRDADRALRRDLASGRDVQRLGIAIGTATDPYQPAEARFQVTRRLLESLLPHSGIPISLVTKSGLIERDTELLATLAKRHDVTVLFSCIILDRHLLRAIERRSPLAHVRFRAMRRLVDAGVRCEMLLMPILPGITDDEANLDSVIAEARVSGASDVHARVLWLTDASRKRFLPWLAEAFPELHARYLDAFGERSMYTAERYRDEIARRVRRLLNHHGFRDSMEAGGRRSERR